MNSEFKNFIIGILASGKRRADCFVCGHKNTLSVSQTGTEIVYYCFSASCGIKGKIKNDLSIDNLRNNSNVYNLGCNDDNYIRQQNFIFYKPNDRCRGYLTSFNIFNIDKLNLLYDPKQNRLVFPLNYKGKNYGYTGRSLDAGTIPKWRSYLRLMGCPFIIKRDESSSSVVLVEDCISALRGMEYFNTIGLLGTSLGPQTAGYLLEYDTIYIALDPDALANSIKLQKQLSSYRPTKILSIDKDIKYMENLELENIRKTVND